MSRKTILCIEDDENLIMVVESYLEDNNYDVLTAGTLAEAMDVAAKNEIDVILLDLTLPDGEGLSLIPQMRAQNSAGIIVVSGKSETTEKIVCLEMGADDYLTKPFEMRELSARIKAVLRRTDAFNGAGVQNGEVQKEEAPKETKLHFGEGWVLDCEQYQLFDPDGVSAELTTGEFQVLEALMRASNRALSREHLFDLTREGNFDVYDRAIDIQIARIRKKLHDDPKSPQIIKTIRGVGYMFVGPKEALSKAGS